MKPGVDFSYGNRSSSNSYSVNFNQPVSTSNVGAPQINPTASYYQRPPTTSQPNQAGFVIQPQPGYPSGNVPLRTSNPQVTQVNQPFVQYTNAEPLKVSAPAVRSTHSYEDESKEDKASNLTTFCFGLLAFLMVLGLILGLLFLFGVIGNSSTVITPASNPAVNGSAAVAPVVVPPVNGTAAVVANHLTTVLEPLFHKLRSTHSQI